LGLYKTSIGNAHVYATKIEGSFILLTIVDGERIVLSPEEPERFLEAIKQRKPFFDYQAVKEITKEIRSSKKDRLHPGLGGFSNILSFFGVLFLGLFSTTSDRAPALRI